MPNITSSDDLEVSASGEGWMETTIADSQTFGEPAMVARRWVLEPGARGPSALHGDADQLLYVIRGSGVAVVDGKELSLDAESLLWLEPGEQYHFVAGRDGLEILQGYAPGE
jgi:quercetin dioxygenase-like cupin family protein